MLEFESWWLLSLPLIFAAGWFASRFDQRQWAQETKALPRGYFRGVNFLLNEQPDQAIDAFVEIAQVDPETIELHFALGALFRRRGETDRAIRIHQNLLSRRDLRVQDRDHALYELALDYYKAGLLDRSEQTIGRLQQSVYAGQADRLLLDIHELARDWTRAIEVATRLASVTGESMAVELAHYHCELAEGACMRDDGPAEVHAIESALAHDPRNLRVRIIDANRRVRLNDFNGAIARWDELSALSAPHLALVADQVASALLAAGPLNRAEKVTRHYYDLSPGVDTLRAWIKAVKTKDGPQVAMVALREELKKVPSLLALQELLSLESQEAAPERQDELSLILKLLKTQANRMSRYVCTSCGFKARTYYWRCPGCSRWQTYGPKRHEEMEAGA